VLEGSGAETIVNGKPCPMEFGDLVLTPAWCWHEHRHTGAGPMIWLDALDVPLHLFLGTAEFEPGPIKKMPETLPDAAFAYANLLPEGVTTGESYSPVFRYPYRDARRAVQAAPKSADGTRRVRYANPVNGGPAMALLDSVLVQVAKGEDSLPLRSNSNIVCCVAEGSGQSQVGNETVSWKEKDIFTLPPGNWISHRSAADHSVLFMVSDRDVLSRLGILREELGNAQV
jgi:gentisate 1,2-dioxygenase